MNYPVDIKKQLINVGLGILYFIGIILVLSWLHLGFWLTVLFFSTLSLIMMLYQGIRNKKPVLFKDWIKSVLYILGIFAFIRLLYYVMPPAWAYALTIIFICGYIIYRRKEKWLEVKWTIERMLFGERIKDLPKDYWKKG